MKRTLTNQIPAVLRSLVAALSALALGSGQADASIAYGSINNFDTVNDTGHECHGFEIEIEDCRSTDITYTYNYNHYGVPKITQDDSVAGHPKCVIRWESKKNADGSWAAYTAIPAGPIAPTNGHMFTNPNVNFGGEHFGVGYRVAVGAVRYQWLIDNGAGVLVHGGAVQVSTPSFTYFPPVGIAPAQVQAVIAPPPPPAPEPKEFGKAVWVKEIRTTTHNNNEVKLRDLVSDDPDDPNDKNWRNGEPDEVEVEWQILQIDYNRADGGANGELVAAPEDLPGGDEVVTRRYEFFKYTGPLDNETGEAMADAVAADGIHGVGTKIINGVEVDLSTLEVVGDFTGSQMAAADVDAPVGLIEHVSEGEVNVPYAARTLVVEGALPFVAVLDGALPPGMAFDEVTGVLDGTPTVSGSFQFTITATDFVNPDVSKNYTLRIAEAGAELAPASLLDTTVSPVGAGTTSGDGSYAVGANAIAVATPAPGFAFLNWMDDGAIVSANASYTLAMNVNHSLVANFVPAYAITTSAAPVAGGTTAGDGIFNEGASATVTATANAGYTFVNWTEGGIVVSNSASYTFLATADRDLVANFSAGLVISTSAAPAAGGTTSGGGAVNSGASVTVIATPNAGYAFVNWTENGAPVSASASYTFTATASRALVANFQLIGGGGGTVRTITTDSTPAAGGTTSGGGSFADGSSVTVVAVPNAGYLFKRWLEGGNSVSTSASYTFTVSADRVLTAKFQPGATINTSVVPAGAGTASGGGLFEDGNLVALAAVPAPGSMFVNWTENGAVVCDTPLFTFQARPETAPVRNLVANFTTGNTVTTYAMPVEAGATGGGGALPLGTSATVVAMPHLGYAFTGWSEGGVVVSTSSSYTFLVNGLRTLVANFVRKPEMHMAEPLPGTLTFSWPAGDDDWVLQESTDLAAWTDSARPVVIVNGQKQFNAATAGVEGAFFRLIRR